MLAAFIKGALTGMAFGVILYKVGATRYSRVMGMVTLRDTKVMKFAFMTIGTASMLYGLAAALGVAEAWNLVPRVMPYLGSAHVLGGVMFGTAMAVTGLCPGTCMAKTGGGSGDRRFAGLAGIAGLVAGVLVYGVVKEPLSNAGVIAANQKPLTLHGILGLPYGAAALIWGALFLVISFASDRLLHERTYEPVHERKTLLDYVRGEWSWIAAGALGGVVIVIATAQGGYLGFSGAILAAVGWAALLLGHPLDTVPRITPEIAWRAALILGALPGGWLAHKLSLPSRAAAEAESQVRKVLDPSFIVRTFLAITVMCLGALIGGGCTTGAFITAWPTLSIGSLAMAGTFFVTAIAVGNLRLMGMRTLDLAKAQALGDRVYD